MLGKILFGATTLLAAGFVGYKIRDIVEDTEEFDDCCMDEDCDSCDFAQECSDYETMDREFEYSKCPDLPCSECPGCIAMNVSHECRDDDTFKSESEEDTTKEEVTEDEKSSD